MAAVVDNLRGMKLLAVPGPDLEPLGFTVLYACLGTVAIRRVIADSHQLGNHQPGAGHRPADPGLDPAAGDARHAGSDDRVTVPPDDCRRR